MTGKTHFLLFKAYYFSWPMFNAQSYQNAESVEYDPVNNQWLIPSDYLASNSSKIIADDGADNLSLFENGAIGFK